MEAYNYILEYELRTTAKVLYPYICTASGLEEWFADKVNVVDQNNFNFIWDDEDHPARLLSTRLNKFAKFEFENSENNGIIELDLEVSELSNSTYLIIKDGASNFENEDEAKELWDFLIGKLKEKLVC